MESTARRSLLLGRKTLYFVALAALLAAAVGVYLSAPVSTVVEAQKADDMIKSDLPARPDRLAIALDLRSAHNLAAFGGGGMTGDAQMRGDRATAKESRRVRQDLERAHSIIKQLDCTTVNGDVTGRTFAPGVYCLSSMRLAGPMTLDGLGDPNAAFVFIVRGSLEASRGAGFVHENGAAPQHVYFWAEDKANVADGVTFGGTILARGDVTVGSGSDIKGRALSVDGKVTFNGESAAGGGTGILEICKQATGGALVYQFIAIDEANRLVRFNSDAPGTFVGPPVPVTGLPFLVAIVAIDIRPSTGELFGLGSNGRLYRINATTGAATVVGTGSVGIIAATAFIGFDFDPIADSIRVSTAAFAPVDNHFKFNPTTGAVTALPDLPENASGVGFTGNFLGAVSTDPYFLSVNDGLSPTPDELFRGVGETGAQTLIGPLGFNANAINGFDIFGLNNAAWAVLAPQGPLVGNSTLYSINLATGAATAVGLIPDQIGPVPLRLRGLSTIAATHTGPPTGLENRIFRFRIGADIYEAPVGGCTGPIELATGNVVVEELNDGRLIGQPLGFIGWTDRFRLVNVNSPTPGALGAVNLPLRTANVFVREGSLNNMTIVNFVNQFAIPAVIEICKRSVAPVTVQPFDPRDDEGGAQSVLIDDTDVSGFFDYTIDTIPGVRFTVPVGFCSGPIQVLPIAEPGPEPQSSFVRVTELAHPSFQLESVTTFPADRLVQVFLNQGVTSSIACSTIGEQLTPPACVFSNPGGGYATGRVVEGGAGNQTTFNFFNRSRPGRLKICKIAGPGIPIGAIFRYTVRGVAPSNPFPGAILPGILVEQEVDVTAGPADQGGFCQFADGLFIVGSPIHVRENLPPVGGPTPNLLGSAPGANGVPGQILISRMRLDATFTGNFSQSTLHAFSTGAFVGITARREVTELEYVNFVFRPTLLKICKIAGEGVAVGTNFTFSLVIDDVGGLFAPPLSIAVPNLTVQAGPASQGGFCQFAQGPYAPTQTTPPVGTFRVGSIVYVTETPAAGSAVSSIASPTGNTLSQCTPVNPNCRGILLGNPGGFNELTFTNIKAPGAQQRTAFDFDGDGKTDISVTRHSSPSTWYQLRSGGGYTFAQFNLGQTGDLIVAADYNGDGKTEAGVFRPSTGEWWVMTEGESVAVSMNAGMVGDIPLPSDYTGDGKADFVLYRPSTGQWFRYENGSTNTSHMAFGAAGDKPLIGDFDGDGKSDPAVFRSSTGTFWYAASSNGSFQAFQWGANGDVPVVADYDGDGKSDYAIFRPSNGEWYVRKSSDGTLMGLVWGMNGDRPIAADYDGDGKADVAIFRPSNGTWYIIKSGSGYQGFVWGVSTDIATPSVYVPN